MIRTSLFLLLVTGVLSGCETTRPCEDILEVKRQAQLCSDLSKVMNDNSRPQQALTARKRYEAECVDLRYYRDDYDTICKKGEQPIGKKEKQQ